MAPFAHLQTIATKLAFGLMCTLDKERKVFGKRTGPLTHAHVNRGRYTQEDLEFVTYILHSSFLRIPMSVAQAHLRVDGPAFVWMHVSQCGQWTTWTIRVFVKEWQNDIPVLSSAEQDLQECVKKACLVMA